MSVTTILLLAALYTGSSFVQGFIGFGMALIAAPLLALAFEPQLAVGMVVSLGAAVNITNLILHRKRVEYRRVLPLALASYPFVPLGAYFLENMRADIVMVCLGTVVILLTLFTMFLESNLKAWMRSQRMGYAFSAASGLLLGAFSTAGPPVVTYFYTGDHDRMRAKANTQFFFTMMIAAGAVTHIGAQNITGYTLARSLPFLPCVLGGTAIGAALSGRVPTEAFHRVTDVLLIGLGAYLILTNM